MVSIVVKNLHKAVHLKLWIARNRIHGMDGSMRKFEKIVRQLEGEKP